MKGQHIPAVVVAAVSVPFTLQMLRMTHQARAENNILWIRRLKQNCLDASRRNKIDAETHFGKEIAYYNRAIQDQETYLQESWMLSPPPKWEMQ